MLELTGADSILEQIRDSLKSSNPMTRDGILDSMQSSNFSHCPMCRHPIPEPGSKEFMQF